MTSSGALILADVAARTDTLAIACNRCDRAGRYHLEGLIAQRAGAAAGAVGRLSAAGSDESV